MNITITGKDLKATEAIKDYIEKKADNRLVKFFGEEFDVYATIKTEGSEQVAQIDVKYGSNAYRAVTAHRDLYASIDKDMDILEGQIRKAKTKKDKQNMADSIKGKEFFIQSDDEIEIEGEILKTLYYDIKPLTAEDAKLKLEEKPQDRFMTFINVDTGKVNVIYKLKDNKNYGLVEPEA